MAIVFVVLSGCSQYSDEQALEDAIAELEKLSETEVEEVVEEIEVAEVELSDELTLVENDYYSIQVPSNLSTLEGFGQEGMLTYGNKDAFFYLMISRWDKSEYTDADDCFGYFKFSYQKDGKTLTEEDLTINNLTAINGFIDGKEFITVEDRPNEKYQRDCTFQMTAIEGNNYFYEVYIWTEQKNAEKYKDKMKEILMTFKEK